MKWLAILLCVLGSHSTTPSKERKMQVTVPLTFSTPINTFTTGTAIFPQPRIGYPWSVNTLSDTWEQLNTTVSTNWNVVHHVYLGATDLLTSTETLEANVPLRGGINFTTSDGLIVRNGSPLIVTIASIPWNGVTSLTGSATMFYTIKRERQVHDQEGY